MVEKCGCSSFFSKIYDLISHRWLVRFIVAVCFFSVEKVQLESCCVVTLRISFYGDHCYDLQISLLSMKTINCFSRLAALRVYSDTLKEYAFNVSYSSIFPSPISEVHDVFSKEDLPFGKQSL